MSPVIKEYGCKTCGRYFEMFGDEIPNCPDCHKPMKRVFSTFGINMRSDAVRQKEAEEKSWQVEADKQERQYKESLAKVKDADKCLEKEFAHIKLTRTAAREKHLERRSTEGTREYSEYNEMINSGE